MNEITEIARITLTHYLKKNSKTKLSYKDPLLHEKHACFVSLHNKYDNILRGCIGTIKPTTANLASEISQNAISAATADLRFLPLTYSELNNINISVDVLSELDPIKSEKDLDPTKYGILVKTDDKRSGLLLPNLDGIEDTKTQLAIACQKGNIGINEPYTLYRFTTNRFEEN